MTVLPIR